MNKSEQVYLTCIDHTVSQEKFELVWNKEKDILITCPQPLLKNLPSYYKSEAYISHTDASKNIVDKVYQKVKKIMLSRKLKLINSFSTEAKTILDIGAGTGDFLQTVANKGWQISGVEPNEKARNLAKAKGVNLLENTTSIKNKQFDVITLWHVLEHIPNLEEQIQELKKLLKPNGFLVIAVPNFKSYDAQYYKNFWAAYDVPRHLWHFCKQGITRLFKEAGFYLSSTQPLWFDSFYVSLLSEKYKSSRSNFLKASFIGLKSNLKANTTKEYSSHIYIFCKAK